MNAVRSFSRLSGLLALIAIPSVPAAETNPAGHPFPKIQFKRSVPAGDLPTLLGSRMGEVATWYGKSDAEFRQMCRDDHSMRADKEGHLHYACSGLVVPADAATGASATVTQQSYPLSQTFLLHSRPGGSKVIYLDFNGHTTSGTSWNSSYSGGGSLTTPPYDIDGAPSSFSNTELTRIQGIWKRVVEDFAPYDVDVTTEDPGVEALRKSSSSDSVYGVRVCIGGSSYDWFGAGAGGVAYVGSFNWSTDTPCFVFTAQLGTGNEKYTAEAVSHEVGHTLGLRHDGQTNGTEYYAGHANWAPIMGVGYYKEVTQWSKGEYSLANNTQDDLNVMRNYGINFMPDEHGDDIASATVLSGTSITASGLITTRTDADLFRFTTGAGTVSFNAAPAVPSPDLDIQLALYDSAGTLVTWTNPAGLACSLTATLPAGTYYLALDGTGTGDPTTAYNDYGSLGEYSLTGSLVPTGNQPPVLSLAQTTPTSGTAPLTVNFSSAGSYDPDGSITAYDWQFGDGGSSSEPNPVYVYANPGTYQATLVAYDDGGLSSAASVTITVQSAPQIKRVYVASIAMSYSTNRRGTSTASAVVTVRDESGKAVSGATVTGSWSGLASANGTATTNRKGQASFKSPSVKGGGTFFFTVTGVTASGFGYDSGLNVETTDSVTIP